MHFSMILFTIFNWACNVQSTLHASEIMNGIAIYVEEIDPLSQ